jgi:hypothetical protein
MCFKTFFIAFVILCCTGVKALSYPIDGYSYTNIKRLKYLQLVSDGELKGTKPIPGAMKSIHDIKLRLTGERGADIAEFPKPDAKLQNAINSLFPDLNENYSVSVMDITEGRAIRYASRKENAGYQPGSVGKLAVMLAFFTELEKVYPGSFEDRQNLLCTKKVRAGTWALTDEHTVSVFNTDTRTLTRRTVKASDVFLLYEWLDYMMSVSNNGAATVCWREAILMRVFGPAYPSLSEADAESYFRKTPKSELSDIAVKVVNEPLRALGIGHEEWRLGTLFTRGGKTYIPGKGGSIGTTLGLMKFLVQMEKGCIIDEESSLEMKRLFYMTDRRIRYAASPDLREASVYFKSGSLYKCKPESGYVCAKYKGNVDNFMNSVAIVEHLDGTTYLVALMSNVRKKNSAADHMALASSIDKKVREK